VCARYENSFPALLKDCPEISSLPSAPWGASPLVDNENWQKLTGAQRENINKMFVTIGKSLAAFERGFMPPVSRFDLYVDALAEGSPDKAATFLNDREVAGLKLFLDPMVGCVNCHNGPMFSNSGFYAVATDSPGQRENDRLQGVTLLLNSEFNCLKWGNAEDCPKVQYIQTDSAETAGAYKVPSLRNLRHAPAFMHDGRYRTIEAVIEHYRNPATLPLRHVDIRPAALLPHQRSQLLSFLEVLGPDPFNKAP
jgi:cytochrome c peroxidase